MTQMKANKKNKKKRGKKNLKSEGEIQLIIN